jgi:hypothetical protein
LMGGVWVFTAFYHIFYWNNAEFACVIKASFAACYLPPGK